MEEILCKGSQAALALALPPALFFSIVGPWFLGFFGNDFRQGSAALQVLILGQLFGVVTGVTVNALLMTKNERPAVLACAVGILINFVLCFLLIPSWDALGAAVATAASLLVINLFLVIQVIRRLEVSPAPWFKPFVRRR
jgi:O-antigen/teichoic acid export membrane protein